MRFGVFASLLFHFAIVGAAYLDLLPSALRPDVTAEPYVPLELIREAELDLRTSVPAALPEVEPDIEEPEPDLPEPEIEEPPAPAEEVVPEQAPEPVPVAEEVIEKIEPEVKPDPKPAPPKPKNDELDFDALSQLINKEKENERAAAPRDAPSQTTETADNPRATIGAGDRLTASQNAKMQAAIKPCWNSGVIIGAPEPEKLVVVLEFELGRDGALASQPRVANATQINLSGNRFWKVAEREAISAVVKCAPYDFLPIEQYETWKDMRLNFNPSLMVGR